MANLPQPGDKLAQYELIERVGAGGMGVVYRAKDLDLERDVAIKVLKQVPASPEQTIDSSLLDRFLREARSAARLHHPNTVMVYQVGRHDDLIFIAMEWVDGGSLSEHLKSSIFLEWREATTAIRDACAGLAAAHDANIIHRDIKPSNLMRTRSGLVKLVDFGLARLHDVPSDLTHEGSVLGTPAYISPEQCKGQPATALSDLYSLACTWFHLLTSRAPYVSSSIAALLHMHIAEEFPDPRRFADEIPDGICAILARAAAKEAKDRYPSAAAMLADLQAVLDDKPLTTAVTLQSETRNPKSEIPHNLPNLLTTFVGRDREIAQAKHALATSRLLTLIGAGGTGKTRLAVHVAHDLLAEFSDGVFLIELAAVAQGELVAQAVAQALGVRESTGQSLTDSLVTNLKERKTLLVLDNCEHVIDAAAAIAQALLRSTAKLRILATSRQALGSDGETTLRVPSLASPDPNDLPPVEQLAQFDAVKLFADRAGQARAGFTVNADNAAAVAQICHRLDGIPLALELAAARIKVLSAQQISQRLDDAFRLLTSGARTALPRQQTLRALIDWSFNLLDQRERIIFARLSVFAGGWSIDAAEAIVAGDGVDSFEVLDVLSELVDKSLVVTSEQGGVVRYRMLETIRQYGAEHLAASGHRDAVRARHLAYFTDLAEKAEARFWAPDQAEHFATVAREHDNIRAALDFFIESQAVDPGMRLAAAMGRYWYMRGNLIESVHRLEQAMNLPDAAPFTPLAKVIDNAGLLSMYRGEMEKAREYLNRALVMGKQLGDKSVEAAALNNLGTLAKEQGNLLGAKEIFERVLVLRREIGEIGMLGGCLNNLGIVAKQLGEAETARKFLTESLANMKQIGNQTWIGFGNLNLGELEMEQGNAEKAMPYYESSYRILHELGDEWGAAYAMEGLGKCAMIMGDLETARKRFEQTLAVCRKLGDRATTADQLDNLAQVALLENDSGSAIPLAEESLSLRIDLRDRIGLTNSLETQAALCAAENPSRAAMLLGCAAAQREVIKAPILPVRRPAHDRLTAQLRAALGAESFESALAQGRTMPAESLVSKPLQ